MRGQGRPRVRRARAGAPRDSGEVSFDRVCEINTWLSTERDVRTIRVMKHERRAALGKTERDPPPSSFWLSILYFLATSFDVAMRSRCRLFRSLFLLLSLHTNHLHPLSRVLFFRGHRVSGRALAYLLNACNALSVLIVSFQTTAKGAPTRFGRHNTSGERPTIARTPSCTHKCTVHSDAQVWARRGRAARIGAQAV